MTKQCSIEGCEQRVDARGWCGMHYERWCNTGSPLIKRSAGNGNADDPPLPQDQITAEDSDIAILTIRETDVIVPSPHGRADRNRCNHIIGPEFDPHNEWARTVNAGWHARRRAVDRANDVFDARLRVAQWAPDMVAD